MLTAKNKERINQDRFFRILAVLIVITGIALRIAEWIHHRDLMMDEVNVVRNLYERNFIGLLKPLYYEQFAPPVFLWMVKICTLVFGFGELSLRLFPLLCSCISLWLLYRLCVKSDAVKGGWYVLSLFSFSLIYLQYGNDVKQYASDALVSLILLLAAVSGINRFTVFKYTISWILLGSFAIWLSMPSVFVLAGVGIFLLYNAFRERRYLYPTLITGVVWLMMFGCYYFLLLKNQLASEYLQSFHKPYFLKISRWSDVAADHNVQLLKDLFYSVTGNDNENFLYFNLLLLAIGFISLFKKGIQFGLLFFVPVFVLIAASVLHLFTLLPRVCILIMPVLLFVIAVGFSTVVGLLKKIWLQIPLYALGLLCIFYSQQLNKFKTANRIEIDELSEEIAFAKAHNVSYDRMYLPILYEPNFIYYSAIHPDKERRSQYRMLRLFKNENYQLLREHINGRSAFLYFWIDDNTLQQHRDSIFAYLQPVDSLVKPSYKVLIFDK